jgi:cell wall-associated NlpC family hydrolase
LDCSGFIKTVFFLNGIILERDASQQYKHGEDIKPETDFSNIRPGDLFFFGKKEPLRIVHVGMYIGNGKVIQSSGRVQISSMIENQPDFSEYLHDTFVGVRRMAGMQPQFGFMPVSYHEWYK